MTTLAPASSTPASAQTSEHPFWDIIRTVPDFPKQGIEFYDITPLLRHHVNEVIDALLAALPDGLLDDVECLVAVEARGFVFASMLAGRLGLGFVLLRKAGKLPPPVITKSYSLEYGKDSLEIAKNIAPAKVVLVDDILATGGTLNTAYELCMAAGHDVLAALVLIDLVELHDDFKLPVYTVLER